MKKSRKISRIALIAHDNRKEVLISWALKHKRLLSQYDLCATGTTGSLLQKRAGLKVKRYKSGPLGGDLQIGSLIAEEKVDFLIFFWDPMFPHPHEPDVRALLRVATVYDVPVATNLSSAEWMISNL